MLITTVAQAVAASAIVGAIVSGGYTLHYLLATSGDFLVSKVTWDKDTKETDELNIECKIQGDKNKDAGCKLFSIDKDTGIVPGFQDFQSASTAATKSTIKTGDFFKMKLNTHVLPTIDISQKVIIEVFKKSEETVIASFRIHAIATDVGFDAYVRHFVATLDAQTPGLTEDVGVDNKRNHFYCKASGEFRGKALNDTSSTELKKYEMCYVDTLSLGSSMKFEAKDIQLDRIKPLKLSGKINKDELKENKYFIIKSSVKYLKELMDKKLKFKLKISQSAKSEEDGKEFTLTPVCKIASRDEVAELDNVDTKTVTTETATTDIKELFLL